MAPGRRRDQERPAGATFTVDRRRRAQIDTRVRDYAGNYTDWRTQTLQIDQTLPEDTSTIASGWVKTRTVSFTATDATSGVEQHQYDIAGPSPTTGPQRRTAVTLAGDGTYTISDSIYDVAGQRTG